MKEKAKSHGFGHGDSWSGHGYFLTSGCGKGLHGCGSEFRSGEGSGCDSDHAWNGRFAYGYANGYGYGSGSG
jgi:hypothetical protein